MKFGVRTPSIKRRISARTTGRLKRSMKRAVNPFYGKKGMGWINNPRKAAYNKIYNKTTVSVDDLFSFGSSRSRRSNDDGCCLVTLFLLPLYIVWYVMVAGLKLVGYIISGIFGAFFGDDPAEEVSLPAFVSICSGILKDKGFTNIETTNDVSSQHAVIIAWKESVKYAIVCVIYPEFPVVMFNGGDAITKAASSKNEYGCNKAAVMTDSVLTESDEKYADIHDVELWDGTPTGSRSFKRNPLVLILSLVALVGYCYYYRANDDKISNAIIIWLVFIGLYILITWLFRGSIGRRRARKDAQEIDEVYESIKASVENELEINSNHNTSNDQYKGEATNTNPLDGGAEYKSIAEAGSELFSVDTTVEEKDDPDDPYADIFYGETDTDRKEPDPEDDLMDFFEKEE